MTPIASIVTDQPLRDFPGTVVLVGAGKMGSALLDGWLALGLERHKLAVIEPQPSPGITALAQRGVVLNPAANAVHDPAVIVLAVKPQTAPEIIASLGPIRAVNGRLVDHGGQDASLPCRWPRQRSGDRAVDAQYTGRNRPWHHGGSAKRQGDASPTRPRRPVARRCRNGRMGERRGLIGRGHRGVRFRAGLCFPPGGNARARRRGSGTAPDLSGKLARATVAGSGELLHRSPEDAATLRKNVTSPGGTTAAALDVLMAADGLAPLMEKAIGAATRRSRDLAG